MRTAAVLLPLFFVSIAGQAQFIFSQGERLTVTYSDGEEPIVKEAVRLFGEDYHDVFLGSLSREAKGRVLIGTYGVNRRIKASMIGKMRHRREAFRISVAGGCLIIAGSDGHGTAYGVMEMCRMIGVSPWRWWADVTPERKERLTISEGYSDEEAPDIAYRGIFINDEDYGFTPWASTNYEPLPDGRIGPKTTARVFELLLRLRANTYWPPMHSSSYPFFMTDGNRETARRFGIYIGSSHCEPMATNVNGEWKRRGEGDYNYVTNGEAVRRFWRQRVEEVRDQEIIYTLGMRGKHDTGMEGLENASPEEKKSCLERVIDDQRAMLPKGAPQVFIPYKEVLAVYEAGLRVPDDVTLMWTDDNYGYIQHFPAEEERRRVGGNGVYYHLSYWGRPQAYTWIGSFSPYLVYQQMRTAYEEGIRKMWIVNVGDIKPLEYQTELFLDMAWDIRGVTSEGPAARLRRYLTRDFGETLGAPIAEILNESWRLAFIRKPEMMANTRLEESDRSWRQPRDLTWDVETLKERMEQYAAIENAVRAIGENIPSERKDAYEQLVAYNVVMAAEINRKYACRQIARHSLREKYWKECFDADRRMKQLTAHIDSGKWRGMFTVSKWYDVGRPVRRDTAQAPMPREEAYDKVWNAVDGYRGAASRLERLGYEGDALGIGEHDTVSYTITGVGGDSLKVTLCLLPTFPIDGHLGVSVSLDDQPPRSARYETVGRSEEWKMGVTTNHRERSFSFPMKDDAKHELRITALSKGVVLDRIKVRGCSVTPRPLMYRPEGEGWICVNGKNRFTRALYGTHTAWRLETSDVPVFAAYKKGRHRNISFLVKKDGAERALDSAVYCKAAYIPGRRDYILKEQALGGDSIAMSVLALAEGEGAVWRVVSTDAAVTLTARTSDIRKPSLYRAGDMGTEAPGFFEATDNNVLTVAASLLDTAYFVIEDQTMRLAARDEGGALYAAAERYRRSIASRLTITTPDPFLNNLGAALSIAADGDWDGDTWLHGCVGWRVQLPGWRAGYVADPLGWDDRAVSHFRAYAESQVTDRPCVIPHPAQDKKYNLARAEERWGTPMYSDGYICRLPHRADKMSHYDMNLNFIDALLWHFQWNADTALMRSMWPVITRHLAWEKMNYDPDGDHLYDAYCCIWASDALYYNSGAVTHSSAYNWRGNHIAALMATLLGYDGRRYSEEADAILKAMNSRLWMEDEGVWAEYRDFMGLKRLHRTPALWTVYTPIDCGVTTASQAALSCDWVTANIPRHTVSAEGLGSSWHTLSTSNWMPYFWSINNVAPAEVMNMALAYFLAGKKEEGFRLMKSNILDNMFLGGSPANFGQLSYYDAARGETYRDFGDVIGVSARVIVEGLFGIVPNALKGVCTIRPAFPGEWDSARFSAPYLDYSFLRTDSGDVYTFLPRFAQHQRIELITDGQIVSRRESGGKVTILTRRKEKREEARGERETARTPMRVNSGTLSDDIQPERLTEVDISTFFNAEVSDIFKNDYLSPSSPYTTLRIPKQGVGEWCRPLFTPDINDSAFRRRIDGGLFDTGMGLTFLSPEKGRNIIYTTLWDNYPDSAVIPLKGRASHAYLLMAGSTNPMQSRIANGMISVEYKEGGADTLLLVNPDNWCPIEQDYFIDGRSFYAAEPRPWRVHLGSGTVSRDLGAALRLTGVERIIPGGAAEIIDMPLDSARRLRRLTLRVLSNDVVIGLMALTLQTE